MESGPEPLKFVPESDASQRRRHGRVRTEDVLSTVGQVLDLSASGMRIRCGRRTPEVGTMMEVGIQGVDGPFLVRAKIVWVTRRGVLTSEAGLEFEGPDESIKAQLSLLARQAVAGATLFKFKAAA